MALSSKSASTAHRGHAGRDEADPQRASRWWKDASAIEVWLLLEVPRMVRSRSSKDSRSGSLEWRGAVARSLAKTRFARQKTAHAGALRFMVCGDSTT